MGLVLEPIKPWNSRELSKARRYQIPGNQEEQTSDHAWGVLWRCLLTPRLRGGTEPGLSALYSIGQLE